MTAGGGDTTAGRGPMTGGGAGATAGGRDIASVTLGTPQDTRSFGVMLGSILLAGDLVLLTGGLGVGKTTLTQGLADGLGVRGPVTSPTFVIARVHRTLVGGPGLVHVDAYRLSGLDELDHLDLDATLEDDVTVVEWGHGLAEGLTEDRLEVFLTADTATEVRTVRLSGHGPRWQTGPGAEAVGALTGSDQVLPAGRPGTAGEPC